MTANENQMSLPCQLQGRLLIKRTPFGRQKYNEGAFLFNLCQSAVNRLCHHQHSSSASVRTVVDCAAPVFRKITRIRKTQFKKTFFSGTADYTFRQRSVYYLRKKCHRVHAHTQRTCKRTNLCPSKLSCSAWRPRTVKECVWILSRALLFLLPFHGPNYPEPV